jgi:hypothetical protein
MPMGRRSSEHASYIRCLMAVFLLSLVLWRSEPEMEWRGAATLPLNKLVGTSDLTTVALESLLLSHHGGERGGGFGSARVVLDCEARQGSFAAAQSWCSSSEALRRWPAVPLPTFLAERRPCGDPALASVRRRPSLSSWQACQKGGSFSFSGVSRRRCPKWRCCWPHLEAHRWRFQAVVVVSVASSRFCPGSFL